MNLQHLRAESGLLSIDWSNGTCTEFSSLWLRDNVREDRDPHSGQRLIDIADLPEDPRIRSAVVLQGGIRIEWQGESRCAWFDLDWLATHAAGRSEQQLRFAPQLWLEGANLDARRDFAWLDLVDARNDRARRTQWMTRLLQDGIAFLSEVPLNEAAILDAVSLIGRVAETNYGVVFDVRSVAQAENLAYSDLGLGLHTDNPYREPVPGFQALHALVASPDGGASLFGDGLALAARLRDIAPDAFACLTQTPIHYNNRSIAPLRLIAANGAAFYGAYRRFADLLRDAHFHLQFKLREGDLVVFDNQRTLHGRTAFSSARYPRHLRGCYLTRDSVYNEAALLRRKFRQDAKACAW